MEAVGGIYHLIARGNQGGRIVVDDADRAAFVTGLERTTQRSKWRLHAYCFMDTHLHLVVETPEPTLSAGMQGLLGGYASYFNRRHSRYGHLFASRFASTVVDTEPYAIELCAYVVLNPLRARLVTAPEDWKWSSYRESAGPIATPSFVETALVPGMLHADHRRARELYRELVRDVAARPRPGSG